MSKSSKDTSSPFDPNFSFGPKQRVNSYATTASTSSTGTMRRVSTNWIKPRAAPRTNVHTTCGRHTDQLLFGGPSLKDLAKTMFGKK